MKWIFALAMLCSLLGCGVMNRYKVPAGSAAASVTFSAKEDDPGWGAALFFDSDACSLTGSPTMAIINGSNPLSFDVGDPVDLPVESGKIYLTAMTTTANTRTASPCRVSFSMDAESGVEYAISLDGTNGACQLLVTDPEGNRVPIGSGIAPCNR